MKVKPCKPYKYPHNIVWNLSLSLQNSRLSHLEVNFLSYAKICFFEAIRPNFLLQISLRLSPTHTPINKTIPFKKFMQLLTPYSIHKIQTIRYHKITSKRFSILRVCENIKMWCPSLTKFSCTEIKLQSKSLNMLHAWLKHSYPINCIRVINFTLTNNGMIKHNLHDIC